MKVMQGLPLAKHRKLYFSSQVDQKTILALTKEIIDINDDDVYIEALYELHGLTYVPDPIEIYIDSYGGNVYQILGLVGIIETSATPIHTIVTGTAMSCGFILLISGHERFAYKHSTPLYHQVSTWFGGKAKDMEIDMKETKRLQKKLEKLTLSKTDITKKKLKQIYKEKIDWFMTAKEAVKYGVVDSIIK